MNSFYASVEQVNNPLLQGKPIIVAGDPEKRHGIILAASYEAKHCGVKTTMPLWEAQKLCPQAILVRPHMATYLEFSVQIMQILKEFSPLIEPFSVDEAFVEITGMDRWYDFPLNLAKIIQERIKNETGISCSIGIAPTKILAKIAADLKKPNGITSLFWHDIPDKLWPLAINKLFGVGTHLENHLQRLGIVTIGDLAKTPVHNLEKRFGIIGRVLYESAHGFDNSPTSTETLNSIKSIGHQFTLPRDYELLEDILVVLRELAEDVARRTRKYGFVGSTITLTLKGENYLQHSLTLPYPTFFGEEIFFAAKTLLERFWHGLPIRMVGIHLGKLTLSKFLEFDLFGETEKKLRLVTATDKIKDKYGSTSLFYALSLTKASLFHDRSKKIGGHKR